MFSLKELLDEEYKSCIDYLNNHYDYCYLDSMHYINENNDIQAIITGLSYGLVGIDAREMKRTINFCMHSQDLYYDYLHAKHAVLKGKGKIRKCYITMGYYSLFYDMSLGVNTGRCSRIYGPLFGDYHHAEKRGEEEGESKEKEKTDGLLMSFLPENPPTMELPLQEKRYRKLIPYMERNGREYQWKKEKNGSGCGGKA